MFLKCQRPVDLKEPTVYTPQLQYYRIHQLQGHWGNNSDLSGQFPLGVRASQIPSKSHAHKKGCQEYHLIYTAFDFLFEAALRFGAAGVDLEALEDAGPLMVLSSMGLGSWKI